MKIAACNYKHIPFGDDACKWLYDPSLMPPGTHYKLLFVFADYMTVIFGPENTVDHVEWMRVVYSIGAVLLSLVCLFMPLRKSDFIVSTSLSALVFPVYTLIGLRYVEGFPAPSFDFIYEVVTVAVVLSYVKGWVVNKYYQTALGTFAKAFYVFLGAPWFVLFLAALDGHWPHIGKDIGEYPTYNLPYFICLVVGLVLAILVAKGPVKIKSVPLRSLFFNFATANYFVFAVLAGVLPTIDFFKEETQNPQRIEFYHFAAGAGLALIATVLKTYLNRGEVEDDTDQDSEIEMADPERGDNTDNPLLNGQSPKRPGAKSMTSNPLWTLSSDAKEGEEDESGEEESEAQAEV